MPSLFVVGLLVMLAACAPRQAVPTDVPARPDEPDADLAAGGDAQAPADAGGELLPRDGDWRPRYHFTPPTAWMNDPNGLVLHAGVYHLFYQHNPESSYFFGPISWGHAASTDLVHWRDRPLALAPDPHLGLAFSGSALVAEGAAAALCEGPAAAGCLVAALTYHGGYDGTEKQGLATSVDGGATWRSYEGNPVLVSPGLEDFRDPHVFRFGDGWRLLLACGDHARLYRSDDLVAWEPVGEVRPAALAGEWECPALLRVPVAGRDEARWMLKVDVNRGPGDASPASRYWLGEFDGTTFVPDASEPQVTDAGPDFYAAQAWSGAPEGRVVWLAWMSHWTYAMAVPTGAWRGAMTVPRELSLRETPAGLRLAQAPVAELEALRSGRVVELADRRLAGRLDLGAVGDALDVTLEVLPQGATEVRLVVLASGDEGTVVGLRAGEGVVYVDRDASGVVTFNPLFPARHQGPLQVDAGRLGVRVLVDRSSVEVFTGTTAITSLVFPRAGSTGLRLEVEGGEALVVRLTADALGSPFAGSTAD